MSPIKFIKDQTRKNGNYLLTEENRSLLQIFIDFNCDIDFIDTKILTKIEKLFNKYLPLVLSETDDKDVSFCLSRNSYHYLLRPFSKTGMVQERLNRNQWIELKATYDTDQYILGEAAKKIDKMRNGRCTVNGKIQNKELRERKQLEEIKGALDPIMRSALEKVTEKFRGTMLEYFTKYFTTKRADAVQWHSTHPEPVREEKYEEWCRWNQIARHYSEVIQSVLPVEPVGNDTVIKLATEVADQQSQSFFFKMSDKLGGLVASPLKEIKEVMIDKSNPFNSTMRFDFIDGTGFTIENKIVLNTSPLGNPFYQFPCVFKDITAADGNTYRVNSEAFVKRNLNQAK
jgi:hypothetical protein